MAFYLPAYFFISQATNILTDVASIEYRCCVAVPQLDQVLQRMKKALEHKGQRVYALNDELIELQPKYDRFLEVARQLQSDQDLVYKLCAALANQPTGWATKEKSGYKLWEMLEVYLRYVACPVQIENITAFLDWIGMDNNRQAIESAIRTHPEKFRTEKRGREKWISLREETDASATKTKAGAKH